MPYHPFLQDRGRSSSSAAAAAAYRPICEYFKNDRCRLGNACRFAHSLKEYHHPELVDSRRAQEEEKQQQQKGKSKDNVPVVASSVAAQLLRPTSRLLVPSLLKSSVSTHKRTTKSAPPTETERSSSGRLDLSLSGGPKQRPRSRSCITVPAKASTCTTERPSDASGWAAYQLSLAVYTAEQLRAAEPEFYED
ncbi:hypothetical protein FOZ63_001793 [Perkinsus olseni]|uniref:C3H1-type domain-containing protein n=1 Tax=Perkinsus olseni TaxID=32597 RepID=A0A7J6NTG5_PEROL|nr:hypothetical protein FOZ60_004229 [Perkinsus olseni]KAF4720106.1 hypothetical protein FOZ63_001793 [Perkinsus olseni]KAF4753828.1 hypothetical protein FOZ62_006469 [Perkinsus olseni]